MIKNIHYCINCMSELPERAATCPDCGSKVGEYVMNPRALKPLTVLNGKYFIGRVLGEGGFGITYIGFDRNLHMKVAIKEYFPVQFATRNAYESNTNTIVVINGSTAENYRKGMERYEKEARRLTELEALPGIVHVYNFFYENNTAYMVMEYLTGTTLKSYLTSGKHRMGWRQALNLVEPVVKSLALLHQKGIIHRDISPDNIMRDADGHITIFDFGAAREIDNDGKSKTIELKRGYAPPEQYQTHGNQGPWTDVYALCATIYHLICGISLPDAFSIFNGTAKVEPIRNYEHTIPRNVEAALMKGLNTEIKNRIKNMDELYDYLYNGTKIIPWKKIIIAASAAVAVGLITILTITGVKNAKQKKAEIIPESVETSEPSERSESSSFSLKNIVKSDEEESGEAKEDDTAKATDTAALYVSRNNLKYIEGNMISTADNDTGVTVTGITATDNDVVIPAEINRKSVTSVSGINSNYAVTVVLPDSLTTIESKAFRNCVYMESIYIPAGVTEIGNRAFDNCISLADIHISADNPYFHVENGKIVDNEGNEYN